MHESALWTTSPGARGRVGGRVNRGPMSAQRLAFAQGGALDVWNAARTRELTVR